MDNSEKNRLKKIDGKELYEIMNRLVKINDSIECLMMLLKVADKFYSYEYNRDIQATLTVIIRYLDSLHSDMQKEISIIDNLMLYAEH